MQASSDLIKRTESLERAFAFIIGALFLLVGIAGFIPGFMTLPAGSPDVAVDAPRLLLDDGYGYVLGLFPTNLLHNAVHIVVGVLGLASATSLSGSLVYNRGFAIAYALIAVMGLLPFTNTTFGLMPIFGNNVWFNALTAIAAAYVGFVKPSELKNADSFSPEI
ncbi:DUF4383 domain-containing protein [Oscillatoria sp. FACHB-1407]|uniref:DUF4383 domain-containing protein n=1 Tax=Oscillatoria sp. FACHB-1407 TaxID=2692847 RepID=UPI001685EA12|nr:DUF4383 domain-containing protein [Oscillatoria sp. FACHB-1407]MBD2464459.1 DUF4383 domain-containing protein [Oscillatoria sp. FACHB-1407]